MTPSCFCPHPPMAQTFAAIALRLTQVPETTLDSSSSRKCEYSLLLVVSKHQLEVVGTILSVRGAERFDKYSVFLARPGSSKQGPSASSMRFASLDEYRKALEKSGVSILDLGEVDRAYYAIGRINADLCVFLQGRDMQRNHWRMEGRRPSSMAENLPWIVPRSFAWLSQIANPSGFFLVSFTRSRRAIREM